MSKHPALISLNRFCRELALIFLTLALASVPFTAAQVQIAAQLASASLS